MEIPEIVTYKSRALALLNDLSDKINNFNEVKEIIRQSNLPETEDEFKQILLEKIVGELELDFTEEDLVGSYSLYSANETLH